MTQNPMAVHLSDHAFRFEYPDDWQLVEQPDDDRHVVTVSPDDPTTIWSATLLFDRPSPSAVLDAVRLAFEEEFQEVDVHHSTGNLAGQKAESLAMEFVCWDLTNTALALATTASRYTLLVLAQFTDSEQAGVEKTLSRITRSLVLGDT